MDKQESWGGNKLNIVFIQRRRSFITNITETKSGHYIPKLRFGLWNISAQHVRLHQHMYIKVKIYLLLSYDLRRKDGVLKNHKI